MSQQSNGDGIPPPMPWKLRICCASASPRRMTAPPMTSLCPPKYLVELWTTMSAPRSSGRCSTGVAKVLSQPTTALRARASFTTAAMSVSLSVGFDGVSIHTRRVDGRIAASTLSTRVVSTKSTCAPHCATISRNCWRVPW
jgi:hypothetical protein